MTFSTSFSKAVCCVLLTIALGIAGCVPASQYRDRDATSGNVTGSQGRRGTNSSEPVVDAGGAIGRNATGVVYIPKHRCAGDGKWPVGACFVEDQTGKAYWYHEDGTWRPSKPKTVSADIAEPPARE